MTVVEEAPLTYALELLTEIDGWRAGRVLHPRFTGHAAFHVTGPVDVAVLRAALDDVVARHGALRTVLTRDDRLSYQRVLAPAPARLAVHDLDPARSPGDFVAEVREHDHPLDDVPLLRAYLGRPGGGRAMLVLVAPHSAADAWSLEVLARDLSAAYAARRGGTPTANEDVMQYTAIAADDRSAKWQARIRDVQPYWRERLTGVTGLGVPPATPDGPGVADRSESVHFGLDDELRRGVTVAARRARTTPFTMLLTAFTAAMYPPGTAGAPDALVPVLTPGRIPSEWETVGFLLNALLIRVERATVGSLDELRRRVDRACREAYANDIPLLTVLRAVPDLVGALIRRDRVLPFFQLVPRVPVRPPAAPAALELTPIPGTVHTPAVLPRALICSMRADDGQLTGTLDYDGTLFPEEWVRQRLAAFRSALTELAGLS